MHRDDSVELFRIEFLPQRGAQSVLSARFGTYADDAQRGAAALSTADGDAGDRADHVLKTRHRGLRPLGGIGQCGAIGRTVEYVERFGGIETKIFRRALMRDVT